MEDIKNFIKQLEKLRIKLLAKGDKLSIDAPKGVLSKELKDNLRQRKEEILSFLNDITSGDQPKTKQKAPLITRADRDRYLPLSFSQYRLWLIDKMQGKSSLYNLYINARIKGTLDIQILKKSLDAIIERHEILRTVFREVNDYAFKEKNSEDSPAQIILPSLEIDIADIDISDLPQKEKEEKAEAIVQEIAAESFDLAYGPLIKCTAVKIGQDDSLILMSVHHIAFDVISYDIFLYELAAFFKAFLNKEKPLLPKLDIQYADFAVWQRNMLTEEKIDSHIAFWKKELENAPFLINLPIDRPRRAIQSFEGDIQTFEVDQNLTELIKNLSRQAGTTLFMTLYSAFAVLLSRYGAGEDIIIGFPITNRDNRQIAPLIGFFVNTMLIRTDLTGSPCFEELLQQVKKSSLKIFEHKDLPFEKLIEKLDIERNLSHQPLIQVMFVFQNATGQPVKFNDIEISPVTTNYKTSKFDLTLYIAESESSLKATLEYSTDIFDKDTIKRLSLNFKNLLKEITGSPKEKISNLNILTQTEREKILFQFNDHYADYFQDKCPHQIFEDLAEKYPDNIALIFEEKSLTYKELNERANSFARYINSFGVEPEDIVGICMERSIDMIISIIGILKAGGAYLPLDPDYPKDRLDFMIQDSGIKFLAADGYTKKLIKKDGLSIISIDELSTETDKQNLKIDTKPEQIAYVIYTSGSTGRPKGVMLEHRGLSNLSAAQIKLFGVGPGSKILQFASLSFDASTWEIVMALCSGASLCLASKQDILPGDPLADVLEKYQITHVTLPPTALNVMPDRDFPYLNTVITAGEACNIDLAKKWAKSKNFINAYGPSESTVCATTFKYNGEDSISIGKPIANTQVYILDKNLKPVPIGVPGELHISGLGLAKGYLNRDDLTKEKFIYNPFKNEAQRIKKDLHQLSKPKTDMLYKTGDLCKWLPDGNIEFLGRIDNQVKIRGFRIELGEIETVISTHPNVKESVAIVREKSSGEKQLLAYIVEKDELSVNKEEESLNIKNYLRKSLPDYMIPSFFVFIDKIPLSPNGKLDRKALPAPDSLNQEAEQDLDSMPKTETEKIIASVWQEVLELKNIGIYKRFFDAGGDSLLTVKTAAKLKKIFNKDISVIHIFQYPTIYELAKYINPNDKLEYEFKKDKEEPAQKTAEPKTDVVKKEPAQKAAELKTDIVCKPKIEDAPAFSEDVRDLIEHQLMVMEKQLSVLGKKT